MSYNGQILHGKHFCVTLSGPKTFEAIRPPWRPILKMAILGHFRTKTHKAIGLLGFAAILSLNGHFEYWPQWRLDGLKGYWT